MFPHFSIISLRILCYVFLSYSSAPKILIFHIHPTLYPPKNKTTSKQANLKTNKLSSTICAAFALTNVWAPLQCSLVTRGNTLTDNPSPVPQQLAISNSFFGQWWVFLHTFPSMQGFGLTSVYTGFVHTVDTTVSSYAHQLCYV